MARCCICEGTNAHQRLCRRCRRDPANADWVVGEEELGAERELNRGTSPLSYAELVRDNEETRLTEVQRQICRLLLRGERVAVPYVDRRGRKRGTRIRKRILTVVEIAERCAVTPQYVRAVRAVLWASLRRT